MAENSSVYIHVGLHKTGTTFLQESVFPYFQNVLFFRGWVDLRTVCRKTDSEPILISDEGYSGNPRGEAYLEEFEKNMLHVKSFFNHPQIIIGFRKHDSFIISLYKQYLQEGGFGEFKEFFKEGSEGIVNADSLFFKPRIELCKKLFENVLIYTQEDLLTNPSENFER